MQLLFPDFVETQLDPGCCAVEHRVEQETREQRCQRVLGMTRGVVLGSRLRTFDSAALAACERQERAASGPGMTVWSAQVSQCGVFDMEAVGGPMADSGGSFRLLHDAAPSRKSTN